MPAPEVTSRLMVFLFTDLVDSTGMKERLGDRTYVRDVLQPHNAIFRELLAQFPGGQERDNAGDGFFVTFESLGDAVRFALLLQYRLQIQAWQSEAPTTRVGIHLGDATEFADSNSGQTKTAGQAIDLAARVMGLGGSRQILLTRAAFDSARQYVQSHPAATEGDAASFEMHWLAHGRYLLKGKEEPMEVFEVGAVGLAPLKAPADSEKAKRVVSHEEEPTLGWRPGAGRAIPRRPGWKLAEKLGEGGFGEVWLAHHYRTKEDRVFKFCFDAERLRSFKRELTLFRLIRDNLGDRDDIARLLEVQVDEAPFYLESEYAPAGNLAEWSERRGGLETLPLELRLNLIARVAHAVAAAHSLGIIHKDIKPSNVLMIEEGDRVRPQLADFGIGILTNPALLARFGITESGFTQSLVPSNNDTSQTGTRLYLPPESQVGKPATTAGDIYALGVMLYQFVTGDLRRPLGQGWEEDVADDLLREDILLCTHRDPARRLPCAGDLAERLETLKARHEARQAARAAEEETHVQKQQAQQQSLKVQALRGILIAASVALALMAGLLFVSHRGHLRAIEHAEDGYAQWALQNNQFAARLAAQKVTEELARCFELVRDEADRPELQKLFAQVAQHSPALARLEDARTPDAELNNLREAFRGEPSQQALKQHLQTRLAHYESVAANDPRALKFASIFVLNTRGTQLANAVFDDSTLRSLGMNWAHRPYFHGGPEVLEPIARTVTNPPHIDRTNLCAAYYSTAQRAWKVAISTPIFGAQQEFTGMVVLTVDLGSFHLASELLHGQAQSVVLVDAREGKEQGTILHHPLFEKFAALGKSIPGELLGEKYHVPASLLTGPGSLDYRDPLRTYTDSEKAAQEFTGRLLAVTSPVMPPIGAAKDADSGLVVLVQSDYDTVVAPTRELGQQFVKSGYWMFAVIATGAFSMLYIVTGTLRDLGTRLPASS